MPRHRSMLTGLQLLAALLLAACPTGEVVPHPACGEGLVLVGQGAGQRCAPRDAGVDAEIPADGDADADVDASVGPLPCDSCEEDPDCPPDHYCVPMTWQGEPRQNLYCLPERRGGCIRVFAWAKTEVESGSGRLVDVCAPDEDHTTCEAVRDMLDEKRCTQAAGCGDLGIIDDAYCYPPSCTIACTKDTECPDGESCDDGVCLLAPQT